MQQKFSLPPELPCACANLRRAARAASQLYDLELAAVDLSVTQFTLLQMLEKTRRIRQRELAELLVMDTTTLTRTLRPLHLDRKLVRKTVGEDRRERYWALTPAGRATIEAARPHWHRAQHRLRQSLGKAIWEQLQIVTRLTAAFRPVDETDAF